MIGILTGIHVLDVLCLQLVAEGVDVPLHFFRQVDGLILLSATNHNNHLGDAFVHQTQHLAQVGILFVGEVLSALALAEQGAGCIETSIAYAFQFADLAEHGANFPFRVI